MRGITRPRTACRSAGVHGLLTHDVLLRLLAPDRVQLLLDRLAGGHELLAGPDDAHLGPAVEDRGVVSDVLHEALHLVHVETLLEEAAPDGVLVDSGRAGHDGVVTAVLRVVTVTTGTGQLVHLRSSVRDQRELIVPHYAPIWVVRLWLFILLHIFEVGPPDE